MAEMGNLALGENNGVRVIGPYRLGQVEEAIDKAAAYTYWETQAVAIP